MAVYTVTFTNPKQNYDGAGGATETVPCAIFDLSLKDKITSSCTILIRTDVLSTYGEQQETSDANAVQNKATAIVKKDGTTWFTGEVRKKTEIQSESGNMLEVLLQGPDAVLLDTFCNYTSLQEWSIKTDFVEVTELPLKKSSTFGDFEGDTLWPDPDDATGAKMYIQDADNPQDTASAIGIADTEITLSTSAKGFQARGWAKIVSDEGTEWVNYDGYDNADTNYKLRNVNRAELEAGAAVNHINNITVYNKVLKIIAPVTAIVENDPGTGYVRLRTGEYSVLPSLGGFVLVESASGDYRATYSVYDFDATLDGGSVAVSLGDLIDRFLRADPLFGGAGFAPGDVNIDAAVSALLITKYDYSPDDKPKDAWNAIWNAIQSVALEDIVRVWYDHTNAEFRAAKIAKDTPTMTIDGVRRLNKDLSIDQVFSCVRVKWVKDQDLNILSTVRSWHTDAADGGDLSKPTLWRKTTSGGDGWGRGPDTSVAAGTFGMDLLIDRKKDSKLSGEFNNQDPGGSFEFGHFWFGDGVTPASIRLNRIKLRVNSYRVIENFNRSTKNTDFSYFVKVQGSQDYNTSTNSGTWFDLGVTMTGIPNVEGKSVVAEFTDFIEREVNAVRIVFDYMAGPKTSGDYYEGNVHEFLVSGNQTNYVIVQTDPTIKNNSRLVWAPKTHKKIRGGIKSSGGAGSPRSVDFPGVFNSEAAAITAGRFFLLTMLLQYQTHIFEYPGELDSKPELYDTITVNDEVGVSYSGLLMALQIINDDGTITTMMRLWDPEADVIQI